MSNRNVSWG